MTQQRLMAFSILILSLFFSGCSKMPSDETIKASIKESLLQQLPLSWSGSYMGYRNPKIDLIEIKEKGKFHSKEKFLMVKARVKGTTEANMLLNNWKLNQFDGVAEFKVHQDDYGKWQAATETMR